MRSALIPNFEQKTDFDHNPNLPNSFRMLIIGSSGSGKSILLLQLLLEPNFIDYTNLIIYSPTKSQALYQILEQGFSNGLSKESIASLVLNQDSFKGLSIPTLCKSYARINPENSGITVMLSDKPSDIQPPESLSKSQRHLIVFDDCVTQKSQAVMASYFTRSRHSNCNCVYLSQDYFNLPKLIRVNSNFLIAFKLSPRNRKDIYSSIVGSMMDKDSFANYVDNVWSKKYSYIVIDRENEKIYDDVFSEHSDIYEEQGLKMGKNITDTLKLQEGVINQRRILKNNLQAQKLLNMGLLEQAAKIQTPTTEAIAKSSEQTQKAIMQSQANILSQAQANISEVKPLQIPSSGKSYNLIKTSQSVKTLVGLLQFLSRAQNQGRIIVFEKGGEYFVWNVPEMANAIVLTPGLRELLFNDANDDSLISLEDIHSWTELIKSAGLGHVFERTELFKNKIRIIQNRLETASTLQPIVKEGEALKVPEAGHRRQSQAPEVITIPLHPDHLREQLILQLRATRAGNSGTFNHVNAILKEMMNQKILKAKEYRAILRNYFSL